jgi:hypothetical protein
MIEVERPLPTWAAYLEAVREEVRESVGIFGEDDHLRTLLQECFDRGDALTGSVLWSEGRHECLSDIGPIREAESGSCTSVNDRSRLAISGAGERF